MAITIFRAKPWIIKINGVNIFENIVISDFPKPIMQIDVPPIGAKRVYIYICWQLEPYDKIIQPPRIYLLQKDLDLLQAFACRL